MKGIVIPRTVIPYSYQNFVARRVFVDDQDWYWLVDIVRFNLSTMPAVGFGQKEIRLKADPSNDQAVNFTWDPTEGDNGNYYALFPGEEMVLRWSHTNIAAKLAGVPSGDNYVYVMLVDVLTEFSQA